MKTNLFLSVFFLCQISFFSTAGEMKNIMDKNAYKRNTVVNPYNGDPAHPDAVSTPTIQFITNGKPLMGWMFASETSTKLMMSVSVDNGATYLTEQAVNSTDENTWGKTTTMFHATPAAGLPVVVKCSTFYRAPWDSNFIERNNYFSNSKAADGWCHLQAMDFDGYADGGTVSVGDGVWLGWEDWMNIHDDYNDMCFVLQGIGARACEGAECVDIKLPEVNTGTRIIHWKEEDKY